MARTALSDIINASDVSATMINLKPRDDAMKAQTLVKPILNEKPYSGHTKSIRRKRFERLSFTRLCRKISQHHEACLIRAKIADARNGLGQRMGEVIVANSKKELQGIAAEVIQAEYRAHRRRVQADVAHEVRETTATNGSASEQMREEAFGALERSCREEVKVLRTSYIEVMEALKRVHDEAVGKLEKSHEEAENARDSLKSEYSERERGYEQRLARLEQSHQEAMASMSINHDEQVLSLRQSLELAMSAKKEEMKAAARQHNDAMVTLQQAHEEAIKKAMAAKKTDVESRIEMLKTNNAEMTAKNAEMETAARKHAQQIHMWVLNNECNERQHMEAMAAAQDRHDEAMSALKKNHDQEKRRLVSESLQRSPRDRPATPRQSSASISQKSQWSFSVPIVAISLCAIVSIVVQAHLRR